MTRVMHPGTDAQLPSGTYRSVPEMVPDAKTQVMHPTGRMLCFDEYGNRVDPVTFVLLDESAPAEA